MVDVKTVAAILGKSESSIWRDARTGKFPRPIKTGPACTRWKVAAVRGHLASLEVPA
ncbi:MAG: AlpA family phage regulatory protein [Azoarcus sp.]|nr:AlpA family phage regulatory protein [Azoarcus sp.]